MIGKTLSQDQIIYSVNYEFENENFKNFLVLEGNNRYRKHSKQRRPNCKQEKTALEIKKKYRER